MQLESLLEKLNDVFADPVKALPFNTKVTANIRTNTNEPIYSSARLYPLSMNDFINN